MIDFAVIAVIAVAVLSSFSASFKTVQASKHKISAVSIANEKVERLKNMPYDELSTQSGAIYPPGDILDEESLTRNNQKFVVNTRISYVDDPYDGNALGTIPGKPVDIYPYDYKKIEISVYKESGNLPLAHLVTDVAAKASETPSNTGIVYLCIIDANNNPVAGADVTITNTTFDPDLEVNSTTDEAGCVMIPALPPDLHNNYHLVVSKDGYSTDMTYPRTDQNPNQIQPDVSIMAQQVTRQTLSIDKVSTLTVNTVDTAGNPIPNLSLHIHGQKEIYFNPSTYKYSTDVQCDETGRIVLPNMEWDNYSFSINTENYFISSVSPVMPVYLAPDSSQEVTIYVNNSTTAPRITAYTPDSAVAGDLTSIEVVGENFDNLAVLKIINATTGVEIIGTDTAVDAHQKITADFALPLDSAGQWHIRVENVDLEFAEQKNGLTIVDGT